jgi:hypothetical protein
MVILLTLSYSLFSTTNFKLILGSYFMINDAKQYTISTVKQHITGIATQPIISTAQPYTIKEFYLLGYNTVQSIESQLTFQRNMSPS